MVRSFSTALALLLCFTAVAAQDAAPENPDRKTEAKAYKLAWNFEKGAKLRYREATVIEQNLDFGMDAVEVANHSTSDYTLHCLGFTEDGAVQIEFTYDRVHAKITTAEGEVEYDTAKPDPELLERSPELKPAIVLAGKSFTYEVTLELKVRNLKGWDKVREAVLAEIGEELREHMEPTYTDEARVSQIEAGLRSLPTARVKIGDKWTRAHTEPAGVLGLLTTDLEMTLKAVEESDDGDVAVIEHTGKLSLKTFADGPFKDMKVEFTDGTSKGTDRYDMKRGCMLKLEMIQSYTMKIEVSEEFVMNQKFNVSYLIELLPDEKPESPDKPAKD